RADGLKTVPEVIPEGSRWRLVALGMSLCLFHLLATYPLPDDLVFTVPVNRPYHHMRLTVFFGFGIPFLMQGHGKTRLRLQPLLAMLIFWLTLQSILLVIIGMWLQLGLAIALLLAVVVLAWPVLRSTEWIWDFGRGAYQHLRDSNTAIPVKIYTLIFSLFPFGLLMPIFGPWERVQLWVRWRPYNVEAELLWRGTFATFFLSFFFTAANPKVNNAIVAFFAAHGICHSISMFFDNRITPTYGNENAEHLLEISLFMVLGLGHCLVGRPAEPIDTKLCFEPWSIALPVFRRPLFPMQNHIIQVTSPTLTKELIRAFEKRPGQNYVSLFLHKQVPPAFEMPEKREDGEEAGEAAEGQVPQVQATAELEELGSENPMEVLCRVGTRAKVMQAMPVVSQSGQQVGLQMLVNGIDIVRMEEVLQKGPPLQVKISQVKYENEDPPDDMLKATMNETMQTIKEIMKVNPGFREYASLINQSYYDRVEKMKAHVVAHFAAALTSADGIDLQKVLEATNAQDKSRLALELVKKELELSKLQQKIASQIEDKMNKHQREFMLREQLKSIKKELGIDKDDGSDALLQKFKQRLEEKTVPKEVKEAIDQELEKFANLAKESQEYQMTRNYLEWLTNTPWGVYSKDTFDLKKAREILDRDHYGLADIKDRIREFIAVGVLRGSMQGKILCFVGPPGVGKTSIGKSIAEALGREFYRFSVGGLYDVAEIKGHRRTYVGAMPGKVIQCLKKTQTANPLILIDEVDKIGRGHQGDPSSALLELLDWRGHGVVTCCPVSALAALVLRWIFLSQLGIGSNILFVCTANVLEPILPVSVFPDMSTLDSSKSGNPIVKREETIPGPLLDRMEVIRLTGVLSQPTSSKVEVEDVFARALNEKMRIAQDYLVPNAMVEVGLRHKEVKTSEQATTAEAPPGEALTAAETSEASSDEANEISKAAETVKPTIKVKAYDAFLSHDWGSGRWLKLLSLLLVFNSRAAFYACFFVSIAVGFLRGFGVLPDALWTVVFSHATFFFVFAFWQRIRLLVCRPRMVFFDKLCVAQHDDALKQRGILSIAAFLLSSRSLVVLLTPQYFSRLWCTFEIATFMKDPERRKQIRFMPLKTALIFLIYSASWHVLVCCYAIFRQIRPEVYGAGAIVAAMMFGLWVVMGPVVLYLEMGMIGDIEKLPVQLRNFRVQEADCFCCTHGHRHPQTGEKIPCDRELVYKSLQKWYGEDYLETFNGRVRTYLPRSLVYGTGGFLLPIRYAVYTVLASSLPYLADPISSSFTAASELSGMALLAWVLRELVEWGLVGLCSLLSVRLSLPLCRMGLRLQMRRCTTAMILVPAIFFIILLVWAPAEIEEAAIESLIRWYCREAGVRNLQKHIERVCRKLATKVVEQLEEKKSDLLILWGAGACYRSDEL
ncbi:unnamed protein product, partial [Symbiodinium sp. KB8]